MRQKRWEKTVLEWDFSISGIGTSVHMDGHFDQTLHDPRASDMKEGEAVHGLFGIAATSQPPEHSDHRRGEMILDIRRLEGPNVPPNATAIVEYLTAEMQKLTEPGRRLPMLKYQPHVRPPERESWNETKFTVSYALGNGEQFCDTSIVIAGAVFEGLGVHDNRGYHLADFSLARETFVELDGAWIPFVRWLRISHRLPIYGPGDMP